MLRCRQRLKKAIDVVKENGNIILFIDEIHNIVGAGSTGEGNMDAANILKPMLSRGELQTIGATTIDEYRRYIEKDSALERRFQPIMVDAPSTEETVAEEILGGPCLFRGRPSLLLFRPYGRKLRAGSRIRLPEAAVDC